MTVGYRSAHLHQARSSLVEAGDLSAAVRGAIGVRWERA
jgi:hypothetical protein